MIEYNKEGTPPELFTAFAHSSAAIVHGDYHKALVTLQQALEKVLDAKDSVDGQTLTVNLWVILNVLEYELQKVYGEQWSDTVGISKPPQASQSDKKELCCSFCGKAQEHVATLIAGSGVNICNECVQLCNEVLQKRTSTSE